MAGVALIHHHHAFIGLEMLPFGIGNRVQRELTLIMQSLDRLRIGAEFTEPCLEVVNRDFVVDLVLGSQAHRIGLDSQVDVFADQHDLWRLFQPTATHLLQSHREDVVVAAAPLQLCR